MLIGGRIFNTDKQRYIMGILNVTPDSFSDGGKWGRLDIALVRAETMVAEGADIIDVGGESTRPGYRVVPDDVEIDRVAPVIEALHSRFDVLISVDTYKSSVASAAINAGAVFINDIWGLKHDADMAGLIANSGVACCLMHNRDNMDYSDFMADMLDDLGSSVLLAKKAGIADDKIIIDPGIGFAKTYEMNLEAINRLDIIKSLGYPVMLGTSRKSVIGTALGAPVTERMEGTLATTVIGVMRGCSIFRVHDVKETRRAITMTEAVLGRNRTLMA